jgi:hypothetical protein
MNPWWLLLIVPATSLATVAVATLGVWLAIRDINKLGPWR